MQYRPGQMNLFVLQMSRITTLKEKGKKGDNLSNTEK